MATITSSDPKRDVELLIQGLKIAQNRQFPDQSIQQPGESEAYRDKTTYKKPKTEGKKLEESGDYLKDPETEVDTSQPLQIKSNPLDELFIDPKTQRQNVRNRKIEDRAKSKDQGADIAKDKLKPEQKIDIPDFLRNVNIKPQDLLKILQLIPAAAGWNMQMANAWPDLKGIGVDIPGPDDDPYDPEDAYSRPLPGAPDGHNLAQVDYGRPTALDKLLGPHQGSGGSLRHMSDQERINLLIRGTKV